LLKVVPGEPALVHSSGDSNSLLVSDVHLGLEKELAKKGFSVPSYSMKMLEKITKLGERFHSDRAVILGDVKHSVGKVEDIDWSILPWFFGVLSDAFGAVDVVPGNHDAGIKSLLPPSVKLHGSDGLVIGTGTSKIGVAHGHAWPSQEVISSRHMVIGHSHFTYEMTDAFGGRKREAVWLSGKYGMKQLMVKAGYPGKARGEGELVVMPPFNRMVGGQPINRGDPMRFGPVLSSGCFRLEDADIFLVDGTRVN
jgi:putative SbcD/Mre11-related phosphoesterase